MEETTIVCKTCKDTKYIKIHHGPGFKEYLEDWQERMISIGKSSKERTYILPCPNCCKRIN